VLLDVRADLIRSLGPRYLHVIGTDRDPAKQHKVRWRPGSPPRGVDELGTRRPRSSAPRRDPPCASSTAVGCIPFADLWDAAAANQDTKMVRFVSGQLHEATRHAAGSIDTASTGYARRVESVFASPQHSAGTDVPAQATRPACATPRRLSRTQARQEPRPWLLSM
jgi:hypothetical protein